MLCRARSFLGHLKKDPDRAMRKLIGLFQDPLFLFQMGKVGSQTHRNTLEARYHVYHLHTRWEFERAFRPYRTRHRLGEQDSFDIITVVREPLGRKISAFFENLVNSPEYEFSFESREAVLEAGMDDLLARFHAWTDGIAEATEWYDRHFKPATGISIYEQGFDPRYGWQIFRQGRWRVLVLRFKDIGENHLEALNEFVVDRYGESARMHRLLDWNLSSRKWYAALKASFCKSVCYSESEREAAYGSRFAQYFYTEEELHKMRAKWKIRQH